MISINDIKYLFGFFTPFIKAVNDTEVIQVPICYKFRLRMKTFEMASHACSLPKTRSHIQHSTARSQLPLAHMEAVNCPTPPKIRSELSLAGTQQMNK